MEDNNSDFEERIGFLKQASRLARVERKTEIYGGGRLENSAEHSWLLMLSAVVLADQAEGKIDLFRVLKMLAIHDLAEVVLDDVCHYFKEEKQKGQDEETVMRELLSHLSKEHENELFSLWKEFELQNSDDARFAAALDRMWPIMQNHNSGGGSWKRLGITSQMALEKNAHVAKGSACLWKYLKTLIEDGERNGFFAEK